MEWFFGLLLVVLIVVLAAVAVLKVASNRAPVPDLGVHGGRLAPCPPSPGCISSQTHPPDDLGPIPFVGSAARVADLVDEIVASRPRATRIRRDGPYLRYAFETYLMRFVDDVEFWVDADARVIHFRAATRSGRDDMGTNRTRMRSLRDEIQEALEREGLTPVATAGDASTPRR